MSIIPQKIKYDKKYLTGCIDGWIDKWVDGWMNKWSHLYFTCSLESRTFPHQIFNKPFLSCWGLICLPIHITLPVPTPATFRTKPLITNHIVIRLVSLLGLYKLY